MLIFPIYLTKKGAQAPYSLTKTNLTMANAFAYYLSPKIQIPWLELLVL